MNRWSVFMLFLVTAISTQAKNYQTFEENGKVGMKDDSGVIVLPPSFEALGWSDGNFSVIGEVTGYRLRGSWGIISLKKEFITPAYYESLVYCGGDCLVARKKINQVITKTGCIGLNGDVKIPFVYDGIFVQGLRAIVFNLTGAKYYFGLANLDNRILIPLAYRNISALGTLRFAVENADKKIALFDDEGKPITDFSIDSISLFYRGYAIFHQNQLKGLIDRNGAIRLESIYNRVNIDEDGRIFAQLPNNWLFINTKNEVVNRLFADEVELVGEGCFIVKKGGVAGLANEELKTIVPIKYRGLAEIEPGRFRAKQDGKMGVISDKGELIIPFSFDSLVYDGSHYRTFDKNFGWLLFTKTGKKLTEKYYQRLLPANNLGFPVVSKGYSGVLDFVGHEFVHCVFDSIGQPVDGLMAVKFKGNYGIIDAKEDWLVAPQNFPLSVINRERYLQRQPENNFVKSYAGEIVYFTPYPLTFNNDNFAEILPEGTIKIINYRGEIIQRRELPAQAEEVFPEHEGLRGIRKDERYGFVDGQGRLRIANRYDSVGEFEEGLAAVKLIGRWGFINTNDEIAINPNYDNSGYFKNGLAVVSRNKKFGLIGKAGNIVLPLRYDKIERLGNGQFNLESSSLRGLADEKGDVLVEPRFNYLKAAGNGLLIACRDGKCGAITDQGLGVVPMIYEQLGYIESKRLFLAEKKSDLKLIDIR